jgi:hypothetical protein
MTDQPLTPAPRTEQPAYQALQLDHSQYRCFLDDCGLPESEQDKMLDAVWAIIVAVIDSKIRSAHQSDDMIALADDSSAMVRLSPISDTIKKEDALPHG